MSTPAGLCSRGRCMRRPRRSRGQKREVAASDDATTFRFSDIAKSGEQSQDSRSTPTAMDSPPPMQIAATPRRCWRDSSAWSKVTRMRVPLAPIG